MPTYLLPVDDDFVESIAKAIAKNRMEIHAKMILQDTYIDGDRIRIEDKNIEDIVKYAFTSLWDSNAPESVSRKKEYLEDTKEVINLINLKLISMPME